MVSRTSNQKEFGSLFEEDYLIRTLGRIAHDPEVALTELVANAWDAGASFVNITIPGAKGLPLVVEDDGHGMSSTQFKARWMKLSYDRAKHQGQSVEFPAERKDWKRKAYGRFGVGRHGMLCFADRYTVDTCRDDKGYRFVVSTHSSRTPFKIEAELNPDKIVKHGTKLSVVVDRHLPDASKVGAILAARFIHDPRFSVRVNGHSIALAELPGLIEQETLYISPGLTVEAFVLDSSKSAPSTLYQGVAFWINRRLVGLPSWFVGGATLIDRRSRLAKRYAIVVQGGDEWIKELEPDWSRFRQSAESGALFEGVAKYTDDVLSRISESFVEENSEDALMRNREQLRELTPLGRIEVASFAQEVVSRNPTINTESLSVAVQAVINLERSRSGVSLLNRLTKLDDTDIEGLDRLLSQWSIRDALTVLDEIDKRLAVIAAIEKLCGEPTTDELHTLHPLVTQARWLFGPEFDSHEYASNVSLRTAAQKIFNKRVSGDAFRNSAQRPDIIVLSDATCSIVATEEVDSHDQSLIRIQNALIIELKKGASAIGREEMTQADGYAQDFLNSGALDGTPMFRVFVVGHEIAARTSREKEIKEEGVTRARILATTYGQLTRHANARLFKLREKLPTRYETATGASLVARVMNRESQSSIPETSTS